MIVSVKHPDDLSKLSHVAKKKNILVTPTVSELRVHSERFKAFFKFFKGTTY